jgi:hypothetical protein
MFSALDIARFVDSELGFFRISIHESPSALFGKGRFGILDRAICSRGEYSTPLQRDLERQATLLLSVGACHEQGERRKDRRRWP